MFRSKRSSFISGLIFGTFITTAFFLSASISTSRFLGEGTSIFQYSEVLIESGDSPVEDSDEVEGGG